MIEIREHSGNGLMALRVSDKLTKGDYDDLIPCLMKHIELANNPCLILIIEDFKGWYDSADFWKDLELDPAYIGYFNRVAVVGDRKWQNWVTQLVAPLSGGEMKFFQIAETKKVWKWLKQKLH